MMASIPGLFVLAMGWPYVIAGYIIVLGGIAAYAAWIIARGRSLMKQVPSERQRFLD